MSLNSVSLDQLTEANLQALVENGVPESRDLEFKRDAVGRDDAAKKEFLKDVSALANTAGGDLIIGLEEDDGVAIALRGVTVAPADEEVRRLESMLQDSLEPRLIGTRMRAIPLTAGGYVLVIRVQKSWNAPHRVVYQRTNRFYGRNAGGVYELGVEQLRAAFLGASEVERSLGEFRLERLARFRSGVGPKLSGLGHLVVHFAPLQAPAGGIDLRVAADPNTGVKPMVPTGWDQLPNFDGIFLPAGRPDEDGRRFWMAQIFRDGRLEVGRGGMTFSRAQAEPRLLSYADSVKELIESVPQYCRALNRAGASSPFLGMVSLLDVGGSVMRDDQRLRLSYDPLDRDDLLFDPFLIEDLTFNDGWQRVLRPMLDAWWNAYGWPRCFHLFDDQGNWTGYPRTW